MVGFAARLRALAGWRAFALATAWGAATALAQPPVSWPFVAFLTLPPLFWLVDGARGPRAAFAVGWCAGAGYFAAGLFWIVEPFLVDPERHGWMAPFALTGLAGGLALFWGTAFAAARAVWPHGLLRAPALAAFWTVAELARAYVLTGFPWALIGYAWVETPVMQAAAVIGPHGLGFLTLAAGLSIGAGLSGEGRRPAVFAVAAVAALVAVGWGYGAWRLALPDPARAEPVVVRLVQPNAAQDLKWRPDMQMAFYQRHLDLTRAPADPTPDVVVWSETAVPFVLGYAEDLQAEVAAATRGVLILGIQRLDAGPDHENWFNSLVVLRPDGRPWAIYDKHRLVPFGEYIPFSDAIAWFGVERLTTLTARGFTAGGGPQLVSIPGLPPFLPLICYEAIFPQFMRAPEGRADWIVQATNDAWFGALSGPYQHLAQARIRAIEQGLPLARAANTGVSAMIDAKGRVLTELPLGVVGYVDVALPASLTKTLYARTGDFPLLIGLLGILLLTVSNFSRSLSSPPRE